MAKQGPQNNDAARNAALQTQSKPIIASPAGIHTTSPRSGNPKFVAGGLFDENGVPHIPKKKRTCNLL